MAGAEMTEKEALEERVRQLENYRLHLEYRLETYHENLQFRLDYDRQFQLKAIWRIVNVACGIGAFAVAYYVMSKWLHMEGTTSGFIAFAAYVTGYWWSDKGHEGDLRNLPRLPEWPTTQ